MSDLATLRQELMDHRDYCERRFEEGRQQFDRLIACVTENTQAVTSANNAICELTAKTRDVVDLYNDVQGAIRLGAKVQKFGLWLSKWPLIGGAMVAGYLWIVEHLGK